MSNPLEIRRRRAAYRAHHRGTKEMDWLLGKYADAELAGMDEAALVQFERFLAIADPELHRWIVSPELCADSEFAGLLGQIRSFHALAG
ncbi:MAG: succinate dehydrogenase assembly factor 2 [Hyphomicrobiaceae bacterium]|nr:succinate dehydrogenase assembly factor 2 [Hyphomicrobiaceae bacterium]